MSANSNCFQLSSGTKMPRIGYGTCRVFNEEELDNALKLAIDVGYRHIDTASVYLNEEFIGNSLKKLFDSGKIRREELFVTTKLPYYSTKPEKVEAELKKSLEKLGLDYVDLYLIHFPFCVKANGDEGDKVFSYTYFETEPVDHIALWKKMEEQVDAGRAKAIGLSNFNKKQIENILKSNPRIKPANLQIELHLTLQQHDLVKYCLDNGISVTAHTPLGCPARNQYLAKMNKPLVKLPDMLNDATVKAVAAKNGKTTAQVMLRYLLQNDIIVIPKSTTPSRIKENFQLHDFTLDDEDMGKLRALDVGEKNRIGDLKMMPGVEKSAEFPF